MPYTESDEHYNFLSQELREQYNIVDTANVSGFNYDHQGQAIIDEYKDGLILDCGAGKREVYFEKSLIMKSFPMSQQMSLE